MSMVFVSGFAAALKASASTSTKVATNVAQTASKTAAVAKKESFAEFISKNPPRPCGDIFV